jgi:hypothetical protein
MVRIVAALFALVAGLVIVDAQRPRTVYQPSLAAYLRATLLQSADRELGRQTEYVATAADLNGDDIPEVVVYLSGRAWCGIGGCQLLVLTPQPRGSYAVVGRISMVKLPVQALASKSHGWRDLVVMVQGGGAGRPYKVRLPFDGTRYASIPTLAPASRLRELAPVEVLISEDDRAQPLVGK